MGAPGSRPPLQYIYKAASDLTTEDVAAWQEICDSDPGQRSPLLSGAFARLMSGVRPDTRVILVFDGDLMIAAMALHHRAFGFARPVAAPFDDVSGPVVRAGYSVSLSEMIEAVAIHAYRAQSALAPDEAPLDEPQPDGTAGDIDYARVISAGGRSDEDHLEALRAQAPKRFKNFRRLSRKLDQEKGPVTLDYGAPDPQRLEHLFAFKQAQFAEEGLVDIIRATQSGAVLKAVADTPWSPESGFGGYMVELRVGDKLIAGHFGVRLGAYFHPWVSAYDPEYADYAPGMVLLYRLVETFSALDLEVYDLSTGHDHYKKYFSKPLGARRPVEVAASSLRGRLQRAGYHGWDMFGAGTDTSIAARLRRRVDHIAVCEHALAARIKGIAYAFKARR